MGTGWEPWMDSIASTINFSPAECIPLKGGCQNRRISRSDLYSTLTLKSLSPILRTTIVYRQFSASRSRRDGPSDVVTPGKVDCLIRSPCKIQSDFEARSALVLRLADLASPRENRRRLWPPSSSLDARRPRGPHRIFGFACEPVAAPGRPLRHVSISLIDG